MPDPSSGVFALAFGRGTVKVGKKSYDLGEADEPIITVADLLAFVGEQVAVTLGEITRSLIGSRTALRTSPCQRSARARTSSKIKRFRRFKFGYDIAGAFQKRGVREDRTEQEEEEEGAEEYQR